MAIGTRTRLGTVHLLVTLRRRAVATGSIGVSQMWPETADTSVVTVHQAEGSPRTAPIDDADDQRAILGLAGIVTAATASIAAIAASGVAWWAGFAGAVIVGCGVSTMVWHGVVRPIRERANYEHWARVEAENALARAERFEDAARRVDDAAAMATSETEVLDLLARSSAAIAPDRELQLLLLSNQTPSQIRWRVPLSESGVGRPASIDPPTSCAAVLRRSTIGHDTVRELDACPHAIGEAAGDDGSTLCIPVPLFDGMLGAIHIRGEARASLGPDAIRALERVTRLCGARLTTLRATGAGNDQPADPLTGLGDRRVFRQELKRVIGTLTPFSIAMCDLDDFAGYNESHGPEAGDDALRLMAATLEDTLRPGDVCCRFGPDVFGVILTDCAMSSALAAMDRLRESVVLGAAEAGLAPPSWSAGITDSTQADSLDGLIESAEIALMVAKHEGGQRVRAASFDEAAPE